MLEFVQGDSNMLSLYNSLTNKKAVFGENEAIKLYVCGLTVYDKAHIGHLRTMLVFDLLVRYLETLGKNVTYVRNITDVDDKIIHRSNREHTDWKTLTESVISEIKTQENALGMREPNVEPKASEHIAEMIVLIEKLIEDGFAYVADNKDVYFSVEKYKDYGQLSGQTVTELIKARRVDDSEKAASCDFVLWKQSKEGEPAWPSPWGEGRPGWHIECSAIAIKHLGEVFDLHGGGVDLKFPHHENEIAQSVCATKAAFAKHWMHVGHLLVDNEKMSKSLDNFITVETFLEQYHPELIRLFLLKTHYRQPYNYTEDAVAEMQRVLLNFYLAAEAGGEGDESDPQWLAFCQALSDDLNVPKALAVMHTVSLEGKGSLLVKMGNVFGILKENPKTFLHSGVDTEKINMIIKERQLAREGKDYQRADEIRDALFDMGVVLEDGKTGTRWYVKYAGLLRDHE